MRVMLISRCSGPWAGRVYSPIGTGRRRQGEDGPFRGVENNSTERAAAKREVGSGRDGPRAADKIYKYVARGRRHGMFTSRLTFSYQLRQWRTRSSDVYLTLRHRRAARPPDGGDTVQCRPTARLPSRLCVVPCPCRFNCSCLLFDRAGASDPKVFPSGGILGAPALSGLVAAMQPHSKLQIFQLLRHIPAETRASRLTILLTTYRVRGMSDLLTFHTWGLCYLFLQEHLCLALRLDHWAQ